MRNQLPVGGILLPGGTVGGWGCGRGGGIKLLQPPVPYNYKLSGGIKNTGTGTWYLLTDGLQSLYCRRTFPFIFTCPNKNIGILYVTN